VNIGLIGLGNLGMPVGKNLLKAGYQLTVHDLRPETAVPLLNLGAVWANSPQQVGDQAQVVITILPSPAAVTAVVEGHFGLLAGMTSGSIWIDSSTNDSRELQRLATLCIAKGIHVLECPVTGGIPKAHDGTITAFVGGPKEIYASCRPIIGAFAGDVHYLGSLGSASVAKVITNMLAFIHLWALGEGLMLGKRAGLEMGSLFESIKASCGNSFVAETEGPEILNGTYDYGFTMALAAKDANLAYELGRQFGVPLEMGGLIEQILLRAKSKYGDQAWSTQVVKLLEDDLNTDLRAPGYETPRIDR
jgi:3-hydroxyisobutyrate dehydrogenase